MYAIPYAGSPTTPYGQGNNAFFTSGSTILYGQGNNAFFMSGSIILQPVLQTPTGQGHVQMPIQPPQTGLNVCQVVLQKNLHHIRNAPCKQCTWQKVNAARGTQANIIFDPKYPTLRFIILPGGQRGWIGLHNL